MLTSFVAEPLLTGIGAGGYMLVCTPAGERVLLDFFVEAPGHGVDLGDHSELVPVDVSFGDAVQVFNIGAVSCGVYGVPAGIDVAARRFGTISLDQLVAPAVRMAREGVRINARQEYIFAILGEIITATPECAAVHAPGGRPLREGELFRNPELGESLERLGRDGAEPFYRGDIATAASECIRERGGLLTEEDLDQYRAVEREPVTVTYRGREVVTNPPPSAGGVLIAYALTLLERHPAPPRLAQLVEVMAGAQGERTQEFLAGLTQEGFLEQFIANKLGSTTHISVLDRDGWACSVTCSNGEGCGIVVPGTGIHLNNMLGEEDLNPLGFYRHEPGQRLPSMMSPTVVLRDGAPELVVGSAGSNRIRSAVLQTIVNVIDREMSADEAVWAPRAHFEDGTVYVEPGIDTTSLEQMDVALHPFSSLNLFFGGVQATERRQGSGELSGCGDPRRGGAAVVV